MSEREFIVVLLAGLEAECYKWEAFAMLLGHDDEAELFEDVGEVVCGSGQIGHDGAVAVLAEADELVVLADDLGGTFGEVEGEGGLVGTEVVDVEDELLGEVFGSTPDNPADSWVDESVPVAGPISKSLRGRGVLAYLCPEVLIETTFSSLKSHSKSGTTNGATNPPDAASI